MDSASAPIESKEDIGSDSESVAKRWLMEIELYEKEFEDWNKLVQEIFKVYKDERKGSYEFGTGDSRFNIYWSNISVLQPTLYSRTPKPEVERRFRDSDSVGRLSASTLQRALDFVVKTEDFDGPMISVRDDTLHTARGVARVFFEPKMGEAIDPVTGVPVEIVVDARVYPEFVSHEDFYHSPARTWHEVRWVAFKSHLTKDEGIKRFGGVFKDVPLSQTSKYLEDHKDELGSDYQMFKKACVYEIWDKSCKCVYWVAKGFHKVLDEKPDPLSLKGFFPCPRPIYGTLTPSSLVPVPDFHLIRDQINELNHLSTRIKHLTEACKVAGAYDASEGDVLGQIMKQPDGKLVPVANWAAFAQKGGIEGAIVFLPIRDVAEVLMRLYEARDRKIGEIYEVTGISDIIRGNSDPSETATAQQIKGQYATLRLSARQAEVQRFARDLIAMMGEVVCEHFPPQILRQISGFDFMPDVNPEDPTEFDQVRELLSSDPLRDFRIDIETDSTIAVDENVEKERRNEFLQALTGFLPAAIQTAQNAPSFAPVMGELLKFSVRTFRAGRQLEGAIEAAVQNFVQELQNPPEQAPDPKMLEVQNRFEIEQGKLGLAQQKLDIKVQNDFDRLSLESERIRNEMMMKLAEIQSKQDELIAQSVINAQTASEPSEPAEHRAPEPPAPIHISLSMANPGKKVVQLGPIDPVTGARTGVVIEAPDTGIV